MSAEGINTGRDDAAGVIGRRLEARYREIAAHSMAGLPICNPALDVAASGFRTYGGRVFGIITTPWFMNLVAADLPEIVPSGAAAMGATVRIGLPAGEVEFIAGELDGFGRLDSCSLFSPVFEFETMQAAVETAEEAARAFFDPAALAPPPSQPVELNRRDLLRGRLRQAEVVGR
jgi:[NiFe] hydrogenase assembly HybE family chaperone